MALEIIKVYTENLPALRFIGKDCGRDNKVFVTKWNEWFENGWFEQLKELGVAPENGDAYLGATQYDDYWIGLLFPPDSPVPEGFESAEAKASKYAIFRLDRKKDGELFGEDGINLVLEELRKCSLAPLWGGWGLERYRCPPGKRVNTLYEFLLEIE